MARETLKSLVAVILTLPIDEQKFVMAELQSRIPHYNAPTRPYTMDEINARLDEAERDIDEGRLFATEEVFHPEYAKAI